MKFSVESKILVKTLGFLFIELTLTNYPTNPLQNILIIPQDIFYCTSLFRLQLLCVSLGQDVCNIGISFSWNFRICTTLGQDACNIKISSLQNLHKSWARRMQIRKYLLVVDFKGFWGSFQICKATQRFKQVPNPNL